MNWSSDINDMCPAEIKDERRGLADDLLLRGS